MVAEMKRTHSVIGGEGNGGVIYPESHYGRDALVGVGLFLSHYVAQSKKMTELKSTYPPYFISKNKMTLSPDMDVDKILEGLKERYASCYIMHNLKNYCIQNKQQSLSQHISKNPLPLSRGFQFNHIQISC